MAKEPNVIREAKCEFVDEKRPIDCKWLQRYTMYEANGNIHLAAKYNGEYLDISAPIPAILELIAVAMGAESLGDFRNQAQRAEASYYVPANIEEV